MRPDPQEIAIRWLTARGQLDPVTMDEYKLVVQGQGADLLAEHLRKNIQVSSDWCEIIPPACSKNLGITRTRMPQILWEDTEDFLAAMRAKGHPVQENITMRAGELKATQREIFSPKVLRALKGPAATQPLLVSKDNYLLDGHHRWAAAVTRDPRAKVRVHKIGLPIKQLLGEAHAYDKAYSAQSLDDFEIPEHRRSAATAYQAYIVKPIRQDHNWPNLLAEFLIDVVGVERARQSREIEYDEQDNAFVMAFEGLDDTLTTFLRMTGLSVANEANAIQTAKKLQKFRGMPPLGVYREKGQTWNYGGRTQGRQTGYLQVWPKAEPIPEAANSYKIRRGRVTVSVGIDKVYVSGATFNIKEDLKSLGCRWDASRKAWWMPARSYSSRTEKTLKSL